MDLRPDQEPEDYDALTKHPGWLRLCNHVRAYWVDQMAKHLEQAASAPDDLTASRRIMQVIVTQREVLRVLDYPAERVKALARNEQARENVIPFPSRRGSL